MQSGLLAQEAAQFFCVESDVGPRMYFDEWALISPKPPHKVGTRAADEDVCIDEEVEDLTTVKGNCEVNG